MSKLTLRGKPKAVAVVFVRLLSSPSTRRILLKLKNQGFLSKNRSFLKS